MTIPQVMVIAGTSELARILFLGRNCSGLTPDTWGQVFQGHIGRYLENNIGNEEDRQSHVVLLARHVQIFFQTRKPRIADIAPRRENLSGIDSLPGSCQLTCPDMRGGTAQQSSGEVLVCGRPDTQRN